MVRRDGEDSMVLWGLALLIVEGLCVWEVDGGCADGEVDYGGDMSDHIGGDGAIAVYAGCTVVCVKLLEIPDRLEFLILDCMLLRCH